MKILLLLLPLFCISAHAELPPVIDNSAYPPSANPARAAVSPTATASYELLGRIDQLQVEIQQLTGKVEEQANLISDLKKRQTTMYADFDERLQAMETRSSSKTSSATETARVNQPPAEEPVVNKVETPSPEPVTETVIDRKPVVEQKQPQEEKPVVAEKPVTEDKAVVEEKTTEKPAAKPELVVASGDEKKDFQQAYTSLRTGYTEQSIAEFNSFLSQYPQGMLAGNAQYWLGEAYRAKQDNSAAQKAYNNVIENYPGSAKLADAILKLGTIEAEQKNPEKAREYFNRVIKDYPNSAAAASATKKLRQLNGGKSAP